MGFGNIIQEFAAGRPVKMVIEGDGASMRGVVRHGDVLTFSPITDFQQITPGDIVFVRWRGGNYIAHLVKEIKEQQCLIVNGRGKINGWVNSDQILARVTMKENSGEQDVQKLLTLHSACALTVIIGTPFINK